MRQLLDLHPIIVNRDGQEASFPRLHDLSGSRIPWFLKPNAIASRERCTHDEVKGVRGSCRNDNILRGTSQTARSSKIGSKRGSKRRVPLRWAVAVRWETCSHRSPRFTPETRGKG